MLRRYLRLPLALFFSVLASIALNAQEGSIVSVTVTPGSVTGGSTQTVKATITVIPYTDPYPVSIYLSSDLLCGAGNLDVPAGQSSWDVTLSACNRVDQATSAYLTGHSVYVVGSTATTNVTILPFQVSLSIAPGSILGGGLQKATGTISIDKPTLVTRPFTLSGTGRVNGPTVVSIAANQNSATFDVSGAGVATVEDDTVNAYFNGSGGGGIVASAPVTLKPSPLQPGDKPDLHCKWCEAHAGSPINLTNGNVWIEQADYSIPGVGGGLALQRTWNSLWANETPVELVGMFGHSWRSSYEERLQTITGGITRYWQANGDFWTFRYDTLNGTYSIVTPLDEHASLAVDTLNSQRILTFMNGTQRIFSSNGYLVALLDRNGNQTTISYDTSNRITQVTDAANRSLTFNYPNANTRQVSSVQDAVGVIATYTYGANSNLIKAVYADGSIINFSYDTSSLLTSVTDTDGKLLEGHTYDSSRRGLTSVRANGVDLVTVSYPSDGRTLLTDSGSNTTEYNSGSIAGRGIVNGTSGPGCASCGGRGNTTYTYDSFGNRTSATDAAGHTTTWTYDAAGNTTSRTVQLDSNTTLTWTYTYNSFGQLLTSTDPLGHTTTNVYDSKGNLLSVTSPSP
jgi:YD repeat-containing protein